MTNPTNATSNLSARIALQSATHHATRTVRRASTDRSAADPMLAARMRWVRLVLASTVTGQAKVAK